MLFTIRRQGRLAQFVGDPASGSPIHGIRRTAVAAAHLAVCAALLAGLTQAPARAQTSTSSNPGNAALVATFIGASAPASAQAAPPGPNAAGNASAGSTQVSNNAVGVTPSSESTDPVSRFLADKGLLPNTKPVVELAQQMRDKATDVASELVLSAMNFLGVPYRRGGNSAQSGFDCSGFTRHVFENSVGLILPRRAIEQANSPDLIPIQKSELKPGDLVFFNTLRHTFSHVGIYIGDDKFIHSPRAGGQVRVEDMRQAYWQQRFDGARRAPKVGAIQSGGQANN
jgi:cell wall-associated NlpC family hydrolase